MILSDFSSRQQHDDSRIHMKSYQFYSTRKAYYKPGIII